MRRFASNKDINFLNLIRNLEKRHVSLCAYFVHPSKFFSFVEWIRDLDAFNHINGSTYLYLSYETKRHTTKKVSISDGKQLLVVGSRDVT